MGASKVLSIKMMISAKHQGRRNIGTLASKVLRKVSELCEDQENTSIKPWKLDAKLFFVITVHKMILSIFYIYNIVKLQAKSLD